MNGELENLRKQLEDVQSKLDALNEEKAKLVELKKNGNFSENLNAYYDSIKKSILASEVIKAKIEEKINAIENKQEEKEDNSYRLSKGMIPYSAVDVYRQVSKTSQPKENYTDDNPVIVDINQTKSDKPEEKSDDKKKRIAQDAIIGALLVGIGIGATKLYDEVKKTNNQTNNNIEQPVDNNQPIAPETDSNITYDYDENTVVIPGDSYANVPNYVEMFRPEYEEMRTLYNLTYADAVDYVNRAHSIQTFNFFPEASIDDIVRLLMNIDNKKLFTNDDDNLSTLLTTVIGQVAENAVWGQPTEDDINKMNALQYLAKDGTDLDIFLTELGEINKRVLSDPYNSEEKHNAYLYLKTFIHSFNSYDNMTNYINEFPEAEYGQELSIELESGEILTDEALKEKAMVKDSYDWYFSYNISSAFSSIYAPIDYNEEEFAKWDELWMRGQAALESPQIQEICNNGLGLTLGGE